MEVKQKLIQSIDQVKIRPTFPSYNRPEALDAHLARVKEILGHCLPKPLPFSDQKTLSLWLLKSLPLISWTKCNEFPNSLSLFVLARPLHMVPIEAFLSELVKHQLLPERETTLLAFEQMHFCFDFALKEPLFVAEIKVLVQSKKDWEIIEERLPHFAGEVKEVLNAGSFTRSLLSVGHLSIDQKMNLVKATIARALKKFPDDLHQRVFQDFSYIHVLASEEFKGARSHAHLARIVVSLYLMRELLDREMKAFPEKRHMAIRYMRAKLEFPFGKKSVLGLAVNVNLFHKYESFEEKHVLIAAEKLIPGVRVVPGSMIHYQKSHSPILSLYIELEKESGHTFSSVELKLLKNQLQDELSKRIEHLVPSLFTVRNEEETMRNILILSEELKSPNDIPQVMISFDQHSQDDLTFTIVLLRVQQESTPPIQELLKNADPRVRFLPDRIQVVSYLDKKYPIEANVFRLQISKLPIFLRMDFSVNLYSARQEVVGFLNRTLGEIRDYNGGMILKQGETFSQFKRLFKDISEKNQELLENFFYSLNPIESQATIQLTTLSLFFDLFLSQVEQKQENQFVANVKFSEAEDTIFAVVAADEEGIRRHIIDALTQLKIDEKALISSRLSFEGVHYFSLLYVQEDREKQELCKKAVDEAVAKWKEQKDQLQTLRLCFHDFVSLDPRIGGDQDSSSIVRMLFDGLMRLDNGKLQCSVAESYKISEDKKHYEFKLKKTFWSNGSPVTAYDFEYAWKKVLSPDFSTPFAYVFYPIKNAKLAKEGKVSVDKVGIAVIDDQTLTVDLEHPAPYFIELTSGTLYSPVNHLVDQMHPNWATQYNEHFICNGPFQLVKPRPAYTYELKKNPFYWNKDKIALDQVILNRSQGKAALTMFEEGRANFLGYPICPIDDVASQNLCRSGIPHPAPKVFWFCLNVNKFPFNHLKMRRALSHAIDRSRIQSIYPYHKVPAYSPLSYNFTFHENADFLMREDVTLARSLFKEALEELGIRIEDFPVIYISASNAGNKRSMAEIVKESWEEVLGIKCVVETYEWHDHFKKLTNGTYEIGVMHWISWINDPIYTLNSFKYRDEKVNFSCWENQQFQQLLDLADQEVDLNKRDRFLAEAEAIIIKEVAVIPVFNEMPWYVAKSGRDDFDLILPTSPLNGNFDFSQVSFKKSS